MHYRGLSSYFLQPSVIFFSFASISGQGPIRQPRSGDFNSTPFIKSPADGRHCYPSATAVKNA